MTFLRIIRSLPLLKVTVVLLGILLIGWPALVTAQDPAPNAAAASLGSSFTYQGYLTDNGSPANGSYDFRFALYDADSGSTQIGSTITKGDVTVADGIFSVALDFGSGAFVGDARYLEVAVRGGGSSGSYTTLAPRRALTAAPYALHSLSTGSMRGAVELDSGNKGGLIFTEEQTGTGDTYKDGFVLESRGSYWNDTGRFPLARIRSVHRSWQGGTAGTAYGMLHFETGTSGDGDGTHSSPSISTRMIINEEGNVGIGTTSPDTTLAVRAPLGTSETAKLVTIGSESGNQRGVISYHRGLGDNDSYLAFGGKINHSGALKIQGDGDVIVGSYPDAKLGLGTSSPQAKLDIVGTARTEVLHITGGADLAEPFDVAGAEQVEAGMVVSIDREHSGQLRLADSAYDRGVAGIVSGAGGIKAGLTMQQEGSVAEGSHPISLSGRVYVWADASYGPIHPSDLLTTSDTPGHAMKVTDYERAQGAILGKAMSTLEEGQGLVLVLVTLQ